MKKIIKTLIICLMFMPYIFLFSACTVSEKTITFNSNGGSEVASQVIKNSNELVEPEDPTKNGYTFDGWFINDEKFDFDSEKITEDTTLTAKWNIQNYEITYILNGGTNNNSNPTTYNIESETITLLAPTKNCYDFAGWYDNSSFSGNEITDIITGSFGNKTLYAKWNAIFTHTNSGTITGLTDYGKTLTELNIPSQIDGIDIVGISYNAFKDCTSLTNVTISNSVTSVGDYAFAGCTNLTSVIFNEDSKCESIGFAAFKSCNSLKNITLPFVGRELTGTENTHFGYIFGIDTYKNNGYIPASLKSVILLNGCKKINDAAFWGCGLLTNITIPNSVTSIGGRAFYGCTHLREITIPNSVTNIANYAFGACEKLKNIEIPQSITSIDGFAFWGCGLLTNITIPNSVTSIGNSAFSNCQSLTDVYIPNSVTNIANYAFKSCRDLKSVVFESESKCTYIGLSAFDGCTSLTNITLPFVGSELTGTNDTCFGYIFGASSSYYNSDYVPRSLKSVVLLNGCTKIDDDAFDGCKSLTHINIPSSVTSIGEHAFDGCNSLTHINIPSSVTNISNYIFSECDSLIDIIIPNTVTKIGTYAFESCASLKNIIISQGVTSIDNSAFDGCKSLTDINIPKSITSIGQSIFSGCDSLTTIVVDKNNKIYDSRDNCNAIIETATNTLITGCKNTIISSSITSIGNYAFDGCNGLVEITIPNTVTKIGTCAFRDCASLKNIIISQCATSIDNSAFAGCKSLTDINIPSSITSIGNSIFSGCDSLTTIVVDKNNKIYDSRDNCNAIIETATNTLITGCKNTIISSSITSIGNYAFAGCNSLIEITIPNSITSIGNYAFDGCKSLVEITIPNSIFSIGDSAFRDCINLISVIFEQESKCESIGKGAFEYCDALTTITLPFIGNTKDITNNSHFGYIFGASAYWYNEQFIPRSLKTVTILKSCTGIGKNAFYMPGNGLQSVIFEETKGWAAYSSASSGWEENIYSSHLENANTALTYLKNTYCQYYWIRTVY